MADKGITIAAQQFEALTNDQEHDLLAEIFAILEYDSDGNPGAEWSSDTTEALGQAFNRYGVTFSEVDS